MLELDRISRLEMKGFPPFADCVIEFPGGRTRTETGWEGKADVHLLTGPNGTGKTRILAALMAALGNDGPLQDRVREEWETAIRVEAQGWEARELDIVERFGNLGMVAYRKSEETSEECYWKHPRPPRPDPSFNLRNPPLRGLAGTGMALLSDAVVSPGAEVRLLKAEDYLNFSSPAGGDTLMQRLLNLRMYVALERDAKKPGRNEKVLAALESAVQEITGEKDFHFNAVPDGRQIRLMAWWHGNDLRFNELPDGLRSLLNWLAGWVVSLNELFPESKDPLQETFVGLLDEPENHLHPEWQRRVIPVLQKHFKGGQLFIATHSPFVVSSLNDGWIHKFSRGGDGKVKVGEGMPAERGDSYLTAVQEVLGLKEFFDVETEAELGRFDALLDAAYKQNGSSEAALRSEAERISEAYGVEVRNLIARLMGQYERTAALRKKHATPKARSANGGKKIPKSRVHA